MKEGETEGHIGRLAGLAVMKDGALVVGDDTNGVITSPTAARVPRC